jgi:DNA methyltransferase 1-associated protein 1
MGDVAAILKGTQAPPSPSSSGANHPKAMKMTGISKEVMTLLAGKQDPKSAALPPIVPTFTEDNGPSGEGDGILGGGKEIKVKVGSKWITSSKPARQWAWAPFASSSRTDGAMFRHWVRANVEYTDYPYAKFDIHLDPVTFTDEEFATYLRSDSWTKSETDKLMELARKYELRWAIIHDRWLDHYFSQERGADIATRKVEDLQERYYTVAAILAQIRIRQEAGAEVQAIAGIKQDPTAPGATEKADQLLLESAAARALATAAPKAQPLVTNIGTGTTNKVFDATQERERRAHLDRLWRRSKEEEREEMELRKELREIETQLRKLKKSGGHVLAAAASGTRVPNAAASRNASRSVTPVPGAAIIDNPELLNQSFASTAPVPMPQTPYLQSGRLAPPAAGGSVGINKSMLTKMQQVLTELKIPARPLPTKRVCDIYDSVRKDILTLVTLQKMVMQKEGTLHAKRVKLSKLGGSDVKVLDEEELLGIAPPPPTPAPAPTPAAKKASSKPSSSSKAKSSTGGGSKSKSVAKPKAAEDASKKPDAKDTKEGSAKKTKSSGTKRKRPPANKDGKEPVKKAATQSGASGGAATSTTTAKTTPKVPSTATKTPPAASTGSTAPAKITKTHSKAPVVADSSASSSTAKKRVRKA